MDEQVYEVLSKLLNEENEMSDELKNCMQIGYKMAEETDNFETINKKLDDISKKLNLLMRSLNLNISQSN